MDINELDLPRRTLDLLRGDDINTVADVQAKGREGLIAIDGIGPKTADEVLAAVEKASTQAFLAEIAEPAPQAAEAMAELGIDVVTVRNETDTAILVGHRWLFPGDVRTVRRFQMVPGLVEV